MSAEGQNLIEYALAGSTIAFAATAGITGLATRIGTSFSTQRWDIEDVKTASQPIDLSMGTNLIGGYFSSSCSYFSVKVLGRCIHAPFGRNWSFGRITGRGGCQIPTSENAAFSREERLLILGTSIAHIHCRGLDPRLWGYVIPLVRGVSGTLEHDADPRIGLERHAAMCFNGDDSDSARGIDAS